MKKVKLISLLVLALLAIVIVLQNTESVETSVLFFNFTMPRAVLLFITTAVGFVLGVLSTLMLWTRSEKKKKLL